MEIIFDLEKSSICHIGSIGNSQIKKTTEFVVRWKSSIFLEKQTKAAAIDVNLIFFSILLELWLQIDENPFV